MTKMYWNLCRILSSGPRIFIATDSKGPLVENRSSHLFNLYWFLFRAPLEYWAAVTQTSLVIYSWYRVCRSALFIPRLPLSVTIHEWYEKYCMISNWFRDDWFRCIFNNLFARGNFPMAIKELGSFATYLKCCGPRKRFPAPVPLCICF